MIKLKAALVLWGRIVFGLLITPFLLIAAGLFFGMFVTFGLIQAARESINLAKQMMAKGKV